MTEISRASKPSISLPAAWRVVVQPLLEPRAARADFASVGASPDSGAESDSSSALDIWKAYMGYLQRLKTSDPSEYQKVPAVLRSLSGEEIEGLDPAKIRVLQSMSALPPGNPAVVRAAEAETAKAYLGMVLKLRRDKNEWGKIPPVLRGFTDQEVLDLDPVHVRALQLLGVFPDTLMGQETQDDKAMGQALLEYCQADPELQKLIEDPALYTEPRKMRDFAAHPKIQVFFATRPDLKHLLDAKVEELQELYLRTFAGNLTGNYGNPGSAGTSPYTAHPYGCRQKPACNLSGNPFNVFGPRIGSELGWLFGFP